MTETAGHDDRPPGAGMAASGAAAVAVRLSPGLRLLGQYQGSGFTEPRYLVRRGDGQVIQLSRLLYLVVSAIADGDADGGCDVSRVAARAGAAFGRDVTADNVRYLVDGKLAPLGVAGTAVPGGVPAAGTGVPPQAPRMNLLLGLRIRGVLLRPRAAGAVGGALAWLHSPPLTAVMLAAFVAFEAWLLGVHGAIGPLLALLRQPVLFVAVAGLTLASVIFHEFGHASACRYGGARPGNIGFGLYLIWPSLYTDVTDAYQLDRAGRLRTDLGGVYFNAIFVLAMAGCYAATGQPVFLAAAFFDNFEILQQLVPVVRMDGYFILGDLVGIPDLFGLIVPIMASVLPGSAARHTGRRVAARADGLRRGPRIVVTTWVLLAVPLLAATVAYTLWHLPAMAAVGEHSFTAGLTAVGAAFSAGHPAAFAANLLSLVLLAVPGAGLAYLSVSMTARFAAAAARLAARLSSRVHVAVFRVGVVALSAFLVTGAGLAWALTPSPPEQHSATVAPARPQPRQQPGTAQAAPAPASPPDSRFPRSVVSAPPEAASPTRRSAWSRRAAGATSPGMADPGRPSTVMPDAPPAVAQPYATPAAVPPRATSAPPRRSTPPPTHTAKPSPGSSASRSAAPTPSPSCSSAAVYVLTLGLLCP
jgi:putative peptide zinc metalloprotease protein